MHPVLETTAPATAAADPTELGMQRVDGVIRDRLASRVVLIDQISRYIVGAGGKRIRPRLVLLFAEALGFEGPERYELAAIVEFIHTATLLHDDVVDESAMRRGRATANAMFGNAASVLVGDFLYSRSYKTAKLFEASARLGAVLAGAPLALEEACAAYGRSLGTAFQLVDDLLDYEGNSDELGKNVGDDLREGKPTLPLLLAMERAGEAERALIRHAIEHGEVHKLPEILAIVKRTGALDATRTAAQKEADEARQALAALPVSRAREALLELCVRSIHRSS